MIIALLICCYVIALYGASTVMVYGSGPFKILERIRLLANSINKHFGLLFSCMMCFPTNLGIICGAYSWWFSPIKFTPFSIIFMGYSQLWWLSLVMDGAFAAGCVWFIHNILEYFIRKADLPDNVIYEDVPDNTIIVDDITRK